MLKKKRTVEIVSDAPLTLGASKYNIGKSSNQMKTLSQFLSEAYDKDVMGSSQIRKTGQRGEIGRDRRKSEPEKRRMKAAGGGKMVPAKSYKDRTDIGQQRQASDRQQQPTQARGSAADAQKAAAKEERRKAAQARIAARKSGKAAPTAAKKTPTATQLLSKKTTKTVSPKYDPKAGKPKKEYTRSERQKLMRQGERELERRVRDAEAEKQGKNPKDVKLKNFSRTWATNK